MENKKAKLTIRIRFGFVIVCLLSMARFERAILELKGEQIEWTWYLGLILLMLASILWLAMIVYEAFYFIRDLFKYGSFNFKIKW
jgi:hypothetical protein